jgi:hypothetical protein
METVAAVAGRLANNCIGYLARADLISVRPPPPHGRAAAAVHGDIKSGNGGRGTDLDGKDCVFVQGHQQ